MLLQLDISRTEIDELANAIHTKHENCQLGDIGVEKNVERILQSYKHTLWGEIFGSFEPIRHIMYVPAFEETLITEEMRDAFGNKDWWLITQRMLANSLYCTFIGLRKIIEKRNQTTTSSITVITQKFKKPIKRPYRQRRKYWAVSERFRRCHRQFDTNENKHNRPNSRHIYCSFRN